MIGRVLDGRYAIVRQLGQGGMGAVYEARHVGTGRRVAIKVILGAQAEGHVARFQREARAVGAVESDHIAQIFDTGRDGELGAPYIAMELLEGEDVQALLERLGPLPVDLALRIALQACLGLERAHAAGVIHRDLKPANLFLARKEQGTRVVKLLDFGIAKVSAGGAADHALTRTGAVMGSPLYMSPEQARGAGGVDARSDLWSLGITLYQCLSGQRPHEEAQGLGELFLKISTTPAPWLPTVAPWVPAEVARIVRRALAIDPAGRPATAGELAGALRALLPGGYGIVEAMLVPRAAGRSAGIAEGGPLATSAPAPPLTLGTSGVDPRAPAAAARRPLGVIAGAAAALGVLGAAGLYRMEHGKTAPAVSAAAVSSALVAAPEAPAKAAAPLPSASALAAPVPSSASAPAAPSPAPAPRPAKRAVTPRPAASNRRIDPDEETSRK